MTDWKDARFEKPELIDGRRAYVWVADKWGTVWPAIWRKSVVKAHAGEFRHYRPGSNDVRTHVTHWAYRHVPPPPPTPEPPECYRK